MRMLISACALALVVGVTAHAQDSTVKSQTQVKTDDASTVVMTGCLRPGFGSEGFMLTGAVASAGKDLKIQGKTKTDVDNDETTVKEKNRAEIEHGDHDAVGTSGAFSEYLVSPRAGVDLASHVNEQVEITAVRIDPKKGDDDAKFKVKEQTKADNEDAPDAKAKSNTKVEVPRGASARLMAMSVKTVGATCSGR